MRAAVVALVLATASCFAPEQPDPKAPSVEARLAKCRAEAIAAFQTAPPETSMSEAEAVYEACKRRLGVSL